MTKNIVEIDNINNCIQRVVKYSRDDANLVYIVILDSLFKWQDETKTILVKLIEENRAKKDKLNGIVLALIEFGRSGRLIDDKIIDSLQSIVNTPLCYDQRGDYKDLVDNVLRLLRENVKIEKILSWYKGRLTFSKSNSVAEPYVNLIIDVLRSHLQKEFINEDVKEELSDWAKDIGKELLSRKKPEYTMPNYVVEMNYELYSELGRIIHFPLTSRYVSLRLRLRIRSLIMTTIRSTGNYFTILGASTAIPAIIGFYANKTVGSLWASAVYVASGIVFFMIYRRRYRDLLK